ncbi:MAG TPA: type II toxin-antitoxin system VapC family toxin [Terracidiphilus sp.]|nr:type II toxin-antitoxin system VapC family toxin [Terracidiphilus sp.]
MAVLLDTNILLRLAQPHHPNAPVAVRALRALRAANEMLHITQQNIVEFWAVATRPIAANGLGLSTEQATAEIAALKRLFVLLPELPLDNAWERLVSDYRVSGKNTHDARLVAAMVVHGIESILTFNPEDFRRYREIRVLDASKIG